MRNPARHPLQRHLQYIHRSSAEKKFDLDLSLAEAVLLAAAERAEAKASLSEGKTEATLPIKKTSLEIPASQTMLHERPEPKTPSSAELDKGSESQP